MIKIIGTSNFHVTPEKKRHFEWIRKQRDESHALAGTGFLELLKKELEDRNGKDSNR